VTIHKWDAARAPFADNLLQGREPTELNDGLLAIPTPGHTKGSVVYLHDGRCLFTGDSLAWNFEANDLTAHRDYCWYSWDEQIQSLTRLLDFPFAWVFAGHGGSKGLPADEMRSRLSALLKRMANRK